MLVTRQWRTAIRPYWTIGADQCGVWAKVLASIIIPAPSDPKANFATTPGLTSVHLLCPLPLPPSTQSITLSGLLGRHYPPSSHGEPAGWRATIEYRPLGLQTRSNKCIVSSRWHSASHLEYLQWRILQFASVLQARVRACGPAGPSSSKLPGLPFHACMLWGLRPMPRTRCPSSSLSHTAAWTLQARSDSQGSN